MPGATPLGPTQGKVDEAIADPYAHLFRTNEPPAQIEIASLRQDVESMVPRISQLRSELEFLEGKPRLYRLALSPARRLPAEILIEIFTFLDDMALLKMSMVCRAWYSASTTLSSKSLSETRIIFPFDIPCSRVSSWLAKPVKGIKTLRLQQAISSPPCGCYKSTVECPWAAPEFAAILTGSPNLGDTNFGFAFSSPACLLSLVGSVGDTPAWRSIHNLDLTFAGTWPGRSNKYRTILNNLPDTLKTLTLRFRDLDKGRSIPPVELPEAPFNALTTLAIECRWDSPFILSVLRASVNVEDLCINFRHCAHTWTGTVAPVHLPKVSSFRLEGPNAQGVVETLKLLHLPSLVRLAVDSPSPDWYGTRETDALKKVMDALRFPTLTRPAAHIQYLALHDVRDSTDSLWSALSVLPFLEHLVFKNVVFDPSGFLKRHRQRIEGRAPDGYSKMLPALRKLEIRSLPHNFDLESFLLYIKSRELTSDRTGTEAHTGERSRKTDGLRRIVLGYHRWVDGAKVEAAWKESSVMLNMLNIDFGMEVERVLA